MATAVKKKSKTTNPSISKKTASKKVAPIKVLEEIRDQNTGLRNPITNRYLERLAVELVEWSKSDSAIVLKEFTASRGILDRTFQRWCKMHEPLAEAHEMAKTRIGVRREKGGLINEYNTGLVAMSMPMYDPDWKEFMEWKASLKNKEDEKGQRQVVVIEKFKEDA